VNGENMTVKPFFVKELNVNNAIAANSSGFFAPNITVGGGATINATSFSGTSNNATNLGGSAASAYQTVAGLSANVAGLTSNNAGYLGGVAAASYVNSSSLTSTLSSYVTSSTLSSYATTSALTSGLAGKQDSLGFTPIPKAAYTDFRTGTDDTNGLTTKALYDAMATVALTDASTIAVDLATGVDFTVTLGGNRTLGAPSNPIVGKTGVIMISQDGTGSRTLAYNSVYKFAGGTAPSLTTTASRVDYLFYKVANSTFIHASLSKDIR
jgi:hypothetical protein